MTSEVFITAEQKVWVFVIGVLVTTLVVGGIVGFLIGTHKIDLFVDEHNIARRLLDGGAKISIRVNKKTQALSGDVELPNDTFAITAIEFGRGDDFSLVGFLKQLNELRNLSILDISMNDETAEEILNSLPKSVQTFGFSKTKITKKTLDLLVQKFPNTGAIRLDNLDFGDEDLNTLKGLEFLGDISVGGTKITNASMQLFKEFPKLHRIVLSGTQISSEGIDALVQTQANITTLLVNKTQITDNDLEKIVQAFPNLITLDIQDTNISNISSLGQLKALKKLRLKGTKANVQDVEILRITLPNAVIEN